MKLGSSPQVQTEVTLQSKQAEMASAASRDGMLASDCISLITLVLALFLTQVLGAKAWIRKQSHADQLFNLWVFIFAHHVLQYGLFDNHCVLYLHFFVPVDRAGVSTGLF